MQSARWKLVSLWFSQFARIMADNALRFFVCIEYAKRGAAEQDSAWHIITAIFVAPAILLAPLNGALCNTLPKTSVLIGTALYGVLIMGVFGILNDHWLWCWALISIGSAIYGPTRYAMLPAAAVDTRWPLTRINGFIEMGTFTAILLGLVVIIHPDLALQSSDLLAPWNTAIALILALNVLAFVTALPVRFPSDVRRDDSPWQAVRGFFSDCRGIWNEREARICLLGLSGKRGLVIGMSGAMMAILFDPTAGFNPGEMATIVGWVAAGVAIGSLLAGLQKHPRRVLGLVPFGAMGFTFGMAFTASGGKPDPWLCVVIGAMAGIINVPLASTFQAALPADARGNGMSVRNMADYILTALIVVPLALLARYAGFSASMQLWFIASLSFLATLAGIWIFRREIAEQLLEIPFAIMYRFRAAGPGLEAFPLKGPVLVVCNHSGYLDPLWLGKIVPRSLIPMMTSLFFDHWFLRWNMVYLADAIRVQYSEFRREVPELKTAIATLDAGKCLVIYPEGRLRRFEEQPLKLFGQGVWHILSERPNTPVVICWLEGGWGSYFSYFNGKPTKGKKFDIAHPISIALGPPHLVPPEILADYRKTRQYLMEQCGQTRKYLGLDPIVLKQVEMEDSEEDVPPLPV